MRILGRYVFHLRGFFRVSWGAECWECLGRRRLGERKEEDTVIFDVASLRVAWVTLYLVVLVHIPLYLSMGVIVSSLILSRNTLP